MGQFGFGQPVRRKEDQRLLTGRGTYVDDRTLPHQAYAHLLRSPHAHAEIKAIDTQAASQAPGVLAVLTGADLAADGIGGVPSLYVPPPPPGVAPEDWSIVTPPFAVLARDRVRLVGDGVALIVAESLTAARDAAELIDIDYDVLPAVTATAAAAEPGAPRLWDEAPGNVCFEWSDGDKDAVDAAFAGAAHVTALDIVNNRVLLAATETRGAIGDYNPADGRFTLYATTQMPHGLKKTLANFIFHVPENRIRVLVGDVGGGFGGKNGLGPEQVLVLWASRRIGRPVKWIGERSEAFLSDYVGRDNLSHGALALDGDGRFLALRVSTVANIGAYVANKGVLSATMYVSALSGVYATPAIHVAVKGVFTNTAPSEPYRGAGRPEANYLLERLIDAAADETGIDRVALRRRNLIPPSAMPFRTPLGLTYDSGEFEINMDDAIDLTKWNDFETRRAEAAQRGMLRGIGMTNYIERASGNWSEIAALRLEADGSATALMGTMGNGQGLETAFAQVVADRLGLHIDDVQVVEGDTDRIAEGRGTGGSASLANAGEALHFALGAVIDKARRIAAHMLEAAPADVAFTDDHQFTIVGTDRVVSLKDVARAAYDPEALPDDVTPGLDESGQSRRPNSTFPNGCHICEVEIDGETGTLRIVGYAMVHDVGRVLNPLLVGGQLHGGVAQGLGQAAMENVVFDDSGQLLSASFMDYCVPRADDMPDFVLRTRETPSPANALGVKGCGEAGATGAPPALVNAVADALRPLGVRHIDMPVTAERLWRVMREARGTGG